eukprot:TRINITY_DN383_c0_g1_i1.p1 TRINITY_DN383_c0_g1~~TRINITY_DN383_c0_g1_i1.p1  ORF type:complete len:321 (+),score=84.25 TRINITY_DN383_c0_g1_i1:179-1141(+)
MYNFKTLIFISVLISLSYCQFYGAICYITTETGNTEVAAINLLNNQSSILTNIGKWAQFPVFSHDLKSVYFASGKDFSQQRPGLTMLYNYNIQEDKLTRVTNNNVDEYTETYIDIGEQRGVIEFQYQKYDNPSLPQGYSRLALISPFGGFTPIMNSSEPYNDYLPKYSTTSNRIVFLSDRSGSTKVYSFDLFTQEVTDLGIPPPSGSTGNTVSFEPSTINILNAGFYYERDAGNGSTIFSYVSPDNEVTDIFDVQKVNTNNAFGVLEYTQCESGVFKGQSMVCSKANDNNGDIVIVDIHTGEQQYYITNNQYVNTQPNWA